MKKLLFLLHFIFCILCFTFSQNVGIGTTTPQKQLSVGGGAVIDQNNTNTGTSANGILSFGSLSGEGIGSKRNAGTGQWGLDFYTNSTNRIAIANNGNVGINITNPSSKLEVRGALGFSSTTKKWEMNYDSTNQYFYIDEFGTNRRFFIKNGGNVGINQSDPQTTLDVNGDVNIENRLFLNNSTGNDGQVLVSNGNAAPSWQNIAYSSNDRFYYTTKNGLFSSLATFEDTLLFDAYYANSSALSYSSSGIFSVNKSGLYSIESSFAPTSVLPTTSTQTPVTSTRFWIKYPASSWSSQLLHIGTIPLNLVFGGYFFDISFVKDWKIYMPAGTQFYFLGSVGALGDISSAGFRSSTPLSINLVSE